MARYIDADKMVSKDNAYTTFPHDLAGCDDNDLVRWINEQPTADVAPKSEVDRLTAELEEKSKRLREVLPIVAELKAEVAREIFEEIEDLLKIIKIPCINAEGCITPMRSGYWAIDPNDFAKLKKKYTGEVDGNG